MVKIRRKYLSLCLVAAISMVVPACYPEDELNIPRKSVVDSQDELDERIQQDFIDEYGVAVRYKFVDRYVDQTKRVTPPKLDVVEPMLNFLTDFWIRPFEEVPNGEDFFRRHVPAEVIFIGSTIYNADGTVTLGTADAGARITLTEVNFIDVEDRDWIFRQLGTIYHEFAHIMHQRYNLPANWQLLSPQGYTSLGSWYNLTDEEALQRGFVSPYGTSTFNEDFAELVAFYLFDPDFHTKYTIDETSCVTADCTARNEGRAKLRQKLAAAQLHYKQNVGVDLELVRQRVQARLP
ncbi:MAG TPA: substrate import-associated zinc metallohydrolase lipoprotein [Chryseosolibacter sp.]